MSIPYNPNVPQANNSPSQDQPVMLGNSQTWNAAWEVDRVPYGSTANVGCSNKTTYVPQSTAPAADTDNGIAFSMLDSNSVAQLFWRLPSSNGGAIMQLSSFVPDGGSGGTSAGSSGYYSYVTQISGVNVTVLQWFWILGGGLQIKVFQLTKSANISLIANLRVPYYGTSQVAAPFSQQPLIAVTTSSFLSSGSAGGGSSGLPCSASLSPSAPTQTDSFGCAYTDAIVVPLAGSSYFTISILVAGI